MKSKCIKLFTSATLVILVSGCTVSKKPDPGLESAAEQVVLLLENGLISSGTEMSDLFTGPNGLRASSGTEKSAGDSAEYHMMYFGSPVAGSTRVILYCHKYKIFAAFACCEEPWLHKWYFLDEEKLSNYVKAELSPIVGDIPYK